MDSALVRLMEERISDNWLRCRILLTLKLTTLWHLNAIRTKRNRQTTLRIKSYILWIKCASMFDLMSSFRPQDQMEICTSGISNKRIKSRLSPSINNQLVHAISRQMDSLLLTRLGMTGIWDTNSQINSKSLEFAYIICKMMN